MKLIKQIIKRTVIAMVILVTVVIVFRGLLYRHFVTYKSIRTRSNYTTSDKMLIEYINSKVVNQPKPSINKIIKTGLSITSSQLKFTSGKCDVDPNKLFHSKATNCVGYATFFASTCNYLLKKYSLSDSWVATINVGKIYFIRTDVHRYFNDSFFKEHDFVTIENKRTGELYAVDPTVNDYFYIDYISTVR